MNSPFFKSSKNQLAPDTSLDPDENAPTLKMGERPDWSLFRSIDGLQQKAGVPATRLRRLVMKEIADNALDTGTGIDAGQIDDHVIYVAENGPGLGGTPQEIAELFSIRRPMRSSKLLRPPQRGALGNGLRVVAGAVLASEGSLAVITRNQRIVLRPEADGTTAVVEVSAVDHPTGTRIEIKFGPALPPDTNPFAWVGAARQIAFEGKSYEGKSSPYWYDGAAFHDLLLAHGDQPVRNLIAQLEGCSGGKAGEIVAAAGLDRMACASVTRGQAVALLATARAHARPVNPEQLGFVGRDAFPEHYYAITREQCADRQRNAAGGNPLRGRGVGQEDRREGRHQACDAGEPHAHHRRDQHLSRQRQGHLSVWLRPDSWCARSADQGCLRHPGQYHHALLPDHVGRQSAELAAVR